MGIPVSSTNKTYCHDITEILLKVAFTVIFSYISFKPLFTSIYDLNHILRKNRNKIM
jgi:hypothetical protein